MPLYETTFIVRQDVSTQEVERLAESFSSIIKENKGEVIKTEQWGLRDLAYPIKKCIKGYYFLLGIDAMPEAIAEMERKAKLNEDVIRLITFNVEEISSNPSAIIAPDEEGEEIVIGEKRNSEVIEE